MKNLKFISPFTALLLLIAFSFSLTGCEKDTETSMQFEVGINKGTATLKTQSNHLVFHTGYVTIREIVFDGDLQGNNAGSVSITREQVTTIDLATGVAAPALDPVVIEAGTYKSPYLGIELLDENATPSLVVEGDFTHTNGSVIPIRFEFNSGEVFESEAATHTFVQDELAIAELKLDPVFWFNTVPQNMLDNANIGPEGFITISESSNSAIFDICADRLDINTQATFR